MSTLAPAQSAAALPPLRISVESVRCSLLWLTGFSGAFVFIEPSPYEVMSLFTAMVFAVSGLTLQASLVPLLTLLFFYNLGFWIAVVSVINEDKTLSWVLISAYLSVTAIFYAAMLAQNTQRRLMALCRGFMLGAVVAAAAGVIGFFNVLPQLSELFLLYERARGTFNDPNVLGAFLVFPAMLALQRIYAGRWHQVLGAVMMLGLFAAAVLLSFSRGAWGQLAFSALVMTGLLFITSRSPQQRLRIAALATLAVVALAIVAVLLYSIDSIGEMFRQRATFEQSYDTGHFGRFGRYILGFDLALDKPWGLGPFQFRRLFVEDPHDVFLNSFMVGGWLSGFCYFTLICVMLVNGLRYTFAATPWRPIYLAVYSVFLGITGESVIIDSDHWRHFFLLLGVLWGLMAATRSYLAEARDAACETLSEAPPEIAPARWRMALPPPAPAAEPKISLPLAPNFLPAVANDTIIFEPFVEPREDATSATEKSAATLPDPSNAETVSAPSPETAAKMPAQPTPEAAAKASPEPLPLLAVATSPLPAHDIVAETPLQPAPEPVADASPRPSPVVAIAISPLPAEPVAEPSPEPSPAIAAVTPPPPSSELALEASTSTATAALLSADFAALLLRKPAAANSPEGEKEPA